MALGLGVLVIAMVGLSFASVPLYQIFCRVTGYGGTTQTASVAPGQDGGPTADPPLVSGAEPAEPIRVRFDAQVNARLPWAFEPHQTEMTLAMGQMATAYFRATNLDERARAGTALFNLTPQKAAIHFFKIECFCFTAQELQPGETLDFAVTFRVDPELATDPATEEVRTVTLSYHFFPLDERKEDDRAALGLGSRTDAAQDPPPLTRPPPS